MHFLQSHAETSVSSFTKIIARFWVIVNKRVVF